MDNVTVMFSLPGPTLDALQARAKREGVAPGAVLRTALARALKDQERSIDVGARDPVLLRALRTLVARDLDAATSWLDLEERLLGRGYALRTDNGALIIVGKDTGEVIGNATDVGTSYGELIRKFNGPLTNHEIAKAVP